MFLDLNSLIILGFVAIAIIVTFSIYQKMAVKEESKEMLKSTFSATVQDASAVHDTDAEYKQSVVDFIDSKLLDRFPVLGERITHAGFKMPAVLYVTLTIIIGIVAAFLAFNYALTAVGKILAAFVPIAVFGLTIIFSLLIVEIKIRARVMEFDEQFGVGLEVLSAAMQAGNTFTSGLQFIARSMDPPLGREFGIVSTELSLGTDLPTVLDRFQDRMPSKNLFLFTTSVKVANHTGAALAPTFLILAGIISERFRLQGMVNIAIAENIGAMGILAVMPWIIIPFLTSSWPEAFKSFSDWWAGQLIMIALFLWYCFGMYIMYKTVRSIDI